MISSPFVTASFITQRWSEKFTPPVSTPMAGMMMSLTSDVTILPKAAPMITPTAMSTTLPLMANSLNSLRNFFIVAS